MMHFLFLRCSSYTIFSPRLSLLRDVVAAALVSTFQPLSHNKSRTHENIQIQIHLRNKKKKSCNLFFFSDKNHSQTFAMSSEPQFWEKKKDFVNVCVTWFDALTLFMRSKHEILYEKWISSSPLRCFHISPAILDARGFSETNKLNHSDVVMQFRSHANMKAGNSMRLERIIVKAFFV